MPFVKVDVKKEIAERRERDPEFRKAWDRRKRQKADEVINTINKAVPLACIFYVIFSLILNVFLAFIAEEKNSSISYNILSSYSNNSVLFDI